MEVKCTDICIWIGLVDFLDEWHSNLVRQNIDDHVHRFEANPTSLEDNMVYKISIAKFRKKI